MIDLIHIQLASRPVIIGGKREAACDPIVGQNGRFRGVVGVIDGKKNLAFGWFRFVNNKRMVDPNHGEGDHVDD